jgi:hypothetical protein
MNLKLIKNETVEMKGVKINGQEFDFSFDVAPLPTSVMRALRKLKGEDDMFEALPPATLGQLVKAWRSEAFLDLDTGATLECTPKNVELVIEQCFQMFGVLASAVMAAFHQAQIKNLKPSPDTTSTTEPVSVEGAGPQQEQSGS